MRKSNRSGAFDPTGSLNAKLVFRGWKKDSSEPGAKTVEPTEKRLKGRYLVYLFSPLLFVFHGGCICFELMAEKG